jgi:RNA polymerase sigma-70 factor (ECF subfamily)
LQELPEEQRAAIELTYFGGLTIAEMAEREGIPLGTAKSRLRLALERMRKTLVSA